MFNETFAVVSDIHGNSWALEAVLEDIERRNIKSIFNLGDLFYGPLDPAATSEVLAKMDIVTVCGNEDRIIFEDSPASPTLNYARQQLSQTDIDRLKSLSIAKSINDEILLFHGTPGSDTEYLIHNVRGGSIHLRESNEIEKLLGARPEKLFLCSHDHLPNIIKLNDKLIVNPGSVGLPAYSDNSPGKHYVENGSPHAKYCVVSRSSSGWRVEQISIPYDFTSAADTAKQNGREDWAHWIKTGRAK